MYVDLAKEPYLIDDIEALQRNLDLQSRINELEGKNKELVVKNELLEDANNKVAFHLFEQLEYWDYILHKTVSASVYFLQDKYKGSISFSRKGISVLYTADTGIHLKVPEKKLDLTFNKLL